MASLNEKLKQCARGAKVYGVSLVPLYVYGRAGRTPALWGKVCTLLGREVAGPHRGMLNPFGGKTERGKSFAETLLDEIREEMCLDMTEKQIMSCLLGIHSIPFDDGVSLVVFVHIVGLQTRLWMETMKKRFSNARLDHKWKEMDMVKHICVVSAQGDKDISGFSIKVMDLVEQKDISSELSRVRPLCATSIRTML